MHKWVDQFAKEPKSLFIQTSNQILEITTSLHWFPPYFFHVLNGTSRVFFIKKHGSENTTKHLFFQYKWTSKKLFLINPFKKPISIILKFNWFIFSHLASLLWYLTNFKSLTHTPSIDGPYHSPQRNGSQRYSPWVLNSKVHGFYNFIKCVKWFFPSCKYSS